MKLELSEVECNNNYEPVQYIIVDGVKTEAALNLELIQDSFAMISLDMMDELLDMMDELPHIIVAELIEYNVEYDEVVKMLESVIKKQP